MTTLLMLTLFAAPDPPTFTASSPAADQPSGRLQKLTPDFAVTLAGKNTATIASVYSLRRTDRAIPPFPTGPQLITTNGDRIVGTLLGGDGKTLRFAPGIASVDDNLAWQVPLSTTAALWLADTPAATPLDLARYDWLSENKNRDVLRFRNGDTARGTILKFGTDTTPNVQFRPEQGMNRDVPATELAAIAFNPALAFPKKPKGPFARVILTDGSRLSLVNPAVDDGILVGELLFGLKVALPVASLVSLDVMLGPAVYLSDLKPRKVEQAGFLGVAWPWAADRNVAGVALQVDTTGGKSTFDKGIGTHPRSVLTYDLGGKYRRFEAMVGVDPASLVGGRAVVRVLVDGKEQHLPGLGTPGKGLPIRVDVSGAKELTLVTDFGPTGGIGADVNWGDARLVE